MIPTSLYYVGVNSPFGDLTYAQSSFSKPINRMAAF